MLKDKRDLNGGRSSDWVTLYPEHDPDDYIVESQELADFEDVVLTGNGFLHLVEEE
jgi:hypothetical protein